MIRVLQDSLKLAIGTKIMLKINVFHNRITDKRFYSVEKYHQNKHTFCGVYDELSIISYLNNATSEEVIYTQVKSKADLTPKNVSKLEFINSL